jgi:tRNA U34 2-thiouridine synthase MnmA/TrmU
MNVAALVSGGVDSSVVVHLLKEQGITPDIFYIRIGMEDEEGYIDCPAEEDIEITTFIARKYGCRFQEVNLHKEYWDNVVSYTIESVRKGLTPNPDVMCNKLIKFGAFEQRCGKDYDRTATGHYAQTECLNVSKSDCVSGLFDKNSSNQAIKQSSNLFLVHGCGAQDGPSAGAGDGVLEGRRLSAGGDAP